MRDKQMVSHSPPFDKVASSSSRPTLQTTPQDPNRRIDTLPPEDQDLPPIPIDLQLSDTSELQRGQAHTQANGHLSGAGQSRSNLRSTPGDRSASRRGVRGGKDSRGPPVRGNDRGRSRPGVRPNDPIPSRMPLVLILAYLYLT